MTETDFNKSENLCIEVKQRQLFWIKIAAALFLIITNPLHSAGKEYAIMIEKNDNVRKELK